MMDAKRKIQGSGGRKAAPAGRTCVRHPTRPQAAQHRTPNTQYRTPNTVHPGFTLIEMITVIAIIAILAAFIFPAMAAVREGGKRTGCMENMRQVVQALKMYKDDWGIYPEALFGYDIIPQSGPQLARRFLYPQYIHDRQAFNCPASEFSAPGQDVEFVDPQNGTTLQPPNRVGDDLCMTPGVLMNQGGALTQGCSYPSGGCLANQTSKQFYLYPWDSYDGGPYPNLHTNLTCGTPAQPFPSRSLNYIANYQRRWVPPDPNNPPDPRQMVLRQPSEQTVVTWCLNHYHLDVNGNPQPGSLALVAFLDGRVQSLPASRMLTWDNAEGNTWKVQAKP